VKAEYDKKLESVYKRPEQVRASHILIGSQNKSDAEKAELKKKAVEVLVEAKKPGADFAELARSYSDCPPRPGRRPELLPPHGAMVEPFAAAAFA